MSNITAYAYDKIQNYLSSTFVYLELQDDTATPIKRFTTADGLIITSDNATNTIEYKITATGDATFLNKTVSKSVIFENDTTTDSFAENTFTAFTFNVPEDELTIIHKVFLPVV